MSIFVNSGGTPGPTTPRRGAALVVDPGLNVHNAIICAICKISQKDLFNPLLDTFGHPSDDC